MKSAHLVPTVHLFVCANRREPASPLGAGCGDAGERLFAALKGEVARRGVYREVWVTETRCLGICPKLGATVAVYPAREIVTEVDVADAGEIFDGRSSEQVRRLEAEAEVDDGREEWPDGGRD